MFTRNLISPVVGLQKRHLTMEYLKENKELCTERFKTVFTTMHKNVVKYFRKLKAMRRGVHKDWKQWTGVFLIFHNFLQHVYYLWVYIRIYIFFIYLYILIWIFAIIFKKNCCHKLRCYWYLHHDLSFN